MERIIALLLSMFTIVLQFGATATNGDYQQKTNLQKALDALKNKDAIIAEYHTGEPSTDVWSPEDTFSMEDCTTLYKEPGKDFVILNLADIHFEDYGYRALYSLDGEMIIKRVVADADPDLIVLSGDIVCGDGSSTLFSIERITDLMESFGVPWAPVFGNHDDEANCDLNFLADVMMSGPHCLMKKGDPAMGVGNYIVNIAEKNGDGTDRIVESLFFMDSHHSQPNGRQTEWLRWAADGINHATGNGAEISLFMHIPIPEYQTAYDEAWDADAKKWRDGYGACGELHETICCDRDAEGNPKDIGFFDAVKETGTTKYIFCSHDHMNDFSINYQGVRLTYCMKLGRGSGYQFGFNGATAIRIGGKGVSRITHKTATYGPLIIILDIDTTK
jgi:hypothetical protein